MALIHPMTATNIYKYGQFLQQKGQHTEANLCFDVIFTKTADLKKQIEDLEDELLKLTHLPFVLRDGNIVYKNSLGPD
jgi:hypothetical protein